jgi:hypothetical protein
VIRIVKASTLAALRRQAARAAEAADRAAEAEEQRRAATAGSLYARHAQAAAQAAQARAEAAYNALLDDTLAGIARTEPAVAGPLTGHAFQAEIALRILRRHIAGAKASGDPGTAGSVRALDALLGQDITLTRETGAAAPLSTEPAEGTRS